MLESVIASPEVVHYICKRFDIKMSKKLGQNFLIKRGIVDEIVHAAELTPGEPVLEVGPGIGTLTQGLAQSGADVTAIELDRRLLEVLDTTLASYDNVRIVHGDVLKLDVPTIMNHKPFKVVANLPYYITTPIIMSLLESKLPPLTLQLLAENVIKHNMISIRNPMVISITYSEAEDQLVVNNSLRPKKSVQSSGIGLRNLSSRYRLICGREITIEHTSDLFIVKIPLLHE